MATREEYAVMNTQVRKFKSKLTRLKNKGNDAGIIALWDEVEDWCQHNMYPDNWRLWERAAEDARLSLSMKTDRW